MVQLPNQATKTVVVLPGKDGTTSTVTVERALMEQSPCTCQMAQLELLNQVTQVPCQMALSTKLTTMARSPLLTLMVAHQPLILTKRCYKQQRYQRDKWYERD